MSNDDEMANFYKNNYVFNIDIINKYDLAPELQKKEKIILSLYMLNWFTISKNKYFNLVCKHPYLTIGDKKQAFYIFFKYAGSAALISTLYCLAGFKFYKMINVKNISLMYVYLAHLSLSILFGISTFKIHFSKKLDEEIKNTPQFEKYFEIKTNPEEIIQELTNYNIKLI